MTDSQLQPTTAHAPTQQYVLRAMAANYSPRFIGDHLDLEVFVRAADEIASLRAKVDELTARELMILAHLYKDAPLKVANLCDDVLDQSGGLLGRVRDSARASLVNSQHQSTLGE